MKQPRMTQLLATLVPAMFEAWNKVCFVDIECIAMFLSNLSYSG
jgi:hypothetical protein